MTMFIGDQINKMGDNLCQKYNLNELDRYLIQCLILLPIAAYCIIIAYHIKNDSKTPTK